MHDGALHGNVPLTVVLHNSGCCTRARVAQAPLHGERRRVRLCVGYCRACVLHKSVLRKGARATAGAAEGFPWHKSVAQALHGGAECCTWARGTRCALHKSRSCSSCALHEGSRCTRAAVVRARVAQSQAACVARGDASHEGSLCTRMRAPRGGLCVARELCLHKSVARGRVSPSLRVSSPKHSGPPGSPPPGAAARRSHGATEPVAAVGTLHEDAARGRCTRTLHEGTTGTSRAGSAPRTEVGEGEGGHGGMWGGIGSILGMGWDYLGIGIRVGLYRD